VKHHWGETAVTSDGRLAEISVKKQFKIGFLK